MTLIFNINFARPNCAFWFLAGMKNIMFLHKKVSIYKVYSTISMNRTSFLHCKHKLMMKSGAPPDKVGVLYRLLPIEFHGFRNIILISKGYHSLVPGLISFFRDGRPMGGSL